MCRHRYIFRVLDSSFRVDLFLSNFNRKISIFRSFHFFPSITEAFASNFCICELIQSIMSQSIAKEKERDHRLTVIYAIISKICLFYSNKIPLFGTILIGCSIVFRPRSGGHHFYNYSFGKNKIYKC